MVIIKLNMSLSICQLDVDALDNKLVKYVFLSNVFANTIAPNVSYTVSRRAYLET